VILRVFDDRRRELTFAAAPKRVVCLVPSDTYNVCAVGAVESLVGRTDWCELPAEVVKVLPSVGGTKNPRVDEIMELSPDLVIANQEENTKGDLEKLAQLGAKVFICFPKRAADGIAHLARLAKIFRTERDPAVRELLKQGYEELREAEAQRAKRVPLRTFCPIWMKPLMTINGQTFISDMLDLAGASNVFADRERRYPLAADLAGAPALAPGERDTRYPRVSMEEVVERKPELVLLPDEPHPFTDEDAAVFAAQPIPAAAQKAIVKTGGKDLCWYGARTVEGLPRLRKLVDAHRPS
jgi:ABC-type Fe3+-hydroxamate transport system substrate-binding protein